MDEGRPSRQISVITKRRVIAAVRNKVEARYRSMQLNGHSVRNIHFPLEVRYFYSSQTPHSRAFFPHAYLSAAAVSPINLLIGDRNIDYVADLDRPKAHSSRSLSMLSSSSLVSSKVWPPVSTDGLSSTQQSAK